MAKMFAPILAFTCNEIWLAMPHRSEDDKRNVVFNEMSKPYTDYSLSDEKMAEWDKIIALRNDVNKALELARADKTIGKSLDAEITLYVSDSAAESFKAIADYDFSTLFITSKVNVSYGFRDGYEAEQFSGISVKVEPSSHPKCLRCWTHNEHIGENKEHPDLCPRCIAAISE